MSANKKDVALLFQEAVDNHLKGNFSRALELYKDVLDKNPKHAESLHHMGLVFMTMGDNAKAVELLQSALSIKQSYPEALSDLGTALKKNKDFF